MEYAESAARIDNSEATRLNARARDACVTVTRLLRGAMDNLVDVLPWRATWLVRAMRAC